MIHHPQRLQRMLVIGCLCIVLSLYLQQSWLAQEVLAGNVASQAAVPVPRGATEPCVIPLNQWERHLIDDDRPGRAVFIDFADIDNDGIEDVVTGGFWYRNLHTTTGSWPRNAVGAGYADTLAVHDFDNDGDFDLLGTAEPMSVLPFVWAQNDGSGNFTVLNNIENNIRPSDWLPIQGVAVAQFYPNGPLQIALAWDDDYVGLQMITVPADPTATEWSVRQAAPETQGEAISAADFDGDGDVDLFMGTAWLRNEWPEERWTKIVSHQHTVGDPDRNLLIDMDDDGDLDAVVGYGHDPEAKVAWYEQPASPTEPWTEHLVAKLLPAKGSPQNLDVADLDGDGDLDIVTAQHRQKNFELLRTVVIENLDGQGLTWQQHDIYVGDEHHDGMQLMDVEGDGDLDIVSIGWMHGMVILYENKGGSACPTATPTSTSTTTPAATATFVATTTTPVATAAATPSPTTTATVTTTPTDDLPQPTTPASAGQRLFLPLITR